MVEREFSIEQSEWRIKKDSVRRDFMTEAEMGEMNELISKVNIDSAELQQLYARWLEEEEAYGQDQPLSEGMPNSRINVILPVIEGLVTEIVDNNWALTAIGEEPGDDQFAEKALIGLDWAFKQNDLFNKSKVHERRRHKFGMGLIKVEYDHEYSNGFGCPMMEIIPLHKLLVDGKIKDFLRWQEAEYMVELKTYGKQYALETFGEEKASAIHYGPDQYRDNFAFQEEYTLDDEDSWTMLIVWSRRNGKLRKRLISGCGLLLYDSAKAGEMKTNQKKEKYNDTPVYKYVCNKYPYFITLKYTKENMLHGFGEARLLMPLQNMVNELYDKIRIQMRPNALFIDEDADLDIEDFDENSFRPRKYNGNKIGGRDPVHAVAWGAINADMFHLLQDIKIEAQRVSRYNDIMSGQGKQADTATEAAIMQQQGGKHATHEKTGYEITLGYVAKYMLGLMMQYMTSGKFFRLFGERADKSKSKYGWVDFSEMTEIPGMVPASQEYKDKYRRANPEADIPEYEILESGSGKSKKNETKSLELDIDVSMGSGLPKNKAFLWQMIEKLSQMMGIDIEAQPQPMPKPLVSWKEMRKIMKQYMDLPIDQDEDMKQFLDALRKIQEQQMQQTAPLTAGQQQQQPGDQQPQQVGQPQPQQAADQNLTQGGNAQMQQANNAKAGGAY